MRGLPRPIEPGDIVWYRGDRTPEIVDPEWDGYDLVNHCRVTAAEIESNCVTVLGRRTDLATNSSAPAGRVIVLTDYSWGRGLRIIYPALSIADRFADEVAS